MDQSTSGPPVLHCLLELGQIHVGRFDDNVQPSHPLSSPFPLALTLSQHLLSSFHNPPEMRSSFDLYPNLCLPYHYVPEELTPVTLQGLSSFASGKWMFLLLIQHPYQLAELPFSLSHQWLKYSYTPARRRGIYFYLHPHHGRLSLMKLISPTLFWGWLCTASSRGWLRRPQWQPAMLTFSYYGDIFSLR